MLGGDGSPQEFVVIYSSIFCLHFPRSDYQTVAAAAAAFSDAGFGGSRRRKQLHTGTFQKQTRSQALVRRGQTDRNTHCGVYAAAYCLQRRKLFFRDSLLRTERRKLDGKRLDFGSHPKGEVDVQLLL